MKLWNKHGHWINDWLTGRLTYWSTDCVLKRLWSLCVAMELSTFTSFACYSTTLCMNPEACELRQWVTTIVESSSYKRCWTGACHRLLKFESDLSIRLWVSSLGQMFYFTGRGISIDYFPFVFIDTQHYYFSYTLPTNLRTILSMTQSHYNHTEPLYSNSEHESQVLHSRLAR